MATKIGDAFISIFARTDKLDKAVGKSSKNIEGQFSKVDKRVK